MVWEMRSRLVQESWRRRVGVEGGGLGVVVVAGFEGCVSGEVCAMLMVCVWTGRLVDWLVEIVKVWR